MMEYELGFGNQKDLHINIGFLVIQIDKIQPPLINSNADLDKIDKAISQQASSLGFMKDDVIIKELMAMC